MNADRTDSAAALLAAFGAQARRRPRAEALRVQQHGAWRRFSWSELAVRAEQAAAGWAALGVGRGDTIVAVGALCESFIVTSIAAELLGAQVRTEPDASLDLAITDAAFVLAQGTRDLDRVLMQGASSLRVLVVENEFGAEPSARVAPVVWQSLIEAGATRAKPQGEAIAEATTREPAPTVLADFPIDWPTGLRWLQGAWPATGATLVIVEPHGDAGATLNHARPGLWIASPQALSAFDAAARERMPSHGLAALAIRTALSDKRSLIVSLLRWRLRRVLGLRATNAVLTDADSPAAAIALLHRLGITVDFDAPHPLEAARPRLSQAYGWAEPFEPVLDRVAQ